MHMHIYAYAFFFFECLKRLAVIFLFPREEHIELFEPEFFLRVIQIYTKFANFAALHFHILQHFATTLCSFIHSKMLFLAFVLDLFVLPRPNLKLLGRGAAPKRIQLHDMTFGAKVLETLGIRSLFSFYSAGLHSETTVYKNLPDCYPIRAIAEPSGTFEVYYHINFQIKVTQPKFEGKKINWKNKISCTWIFQLSTVWLSLVTQSHL